jgi:hypothetical protein
MSTTANLPRKLAAMGGAYGNLEALQSCLADAASAGVNLKAFLGDSIGCCAHSNEVVAMIRSGFDVFVLSNRKIPLNGFHCRTNQPVEFTVAHHRRSDRVDPTKYEQTQHYTQNSEYDPYECHLFVSPRIFAKYCEK